jgi:hypothetical protein
VGLRRSSYSLHSVDRGTKLHNLTASKPFDSETVAMGVHSTNIAALPLQTGAKFNVMISHDHDHDGDVMRRKDCVGLPNVVPLASTSVRRDSPHLHMCPSKSSLSQVTTMEAKTKVHPRPGAHSAGQMQSRIAFSGRHDGDATSSWAGSKKWLGSCLIIPKVTGRLACGSGGRQIPSPANYPDTVAPTHPRVQSVYLPSLSPPIPDAPIVRPPLPRRSGRGCVCECV